MKKEERKVLKDINDFIDLNIQTNKSYEWKSGYKNFGILLLGFCEWIHSRKEKDQEIFFLARDGFIIKKVYEMLYPEDKTHYLYVSRRSLFLPSIYESKDVEKIVSRLVLPPIFTVETFLQAFQLNVEETKDKINKANISLDETFKRKTFKDDKRILNLTQMILPEITNKANNQYEYFKTYLEQENFKDNSLIVDIGWHNSIQKLLCKITNYKNLNGCYIAVYKSANKFSSGSANGYLYEYGNNINRQYETFSFVSLFETMFLSHEGTTLGYQKDKKQVTPVIAPYEYANELDSLKLVDDFQSGAITFIEDYIKHDCKWNLTSNVCGYNLIKFGSRPTTKDINEFGKISFENYKTHNIINYNNSSFYYFTHIKTMINDFYCSGWRVAFLKKLFKIPFPYYYIFKIICHFFQKEQS